MAAAHPSEALPSFPRWLPWALAFAVFAVGFGLYARALGYELLDWDDQVYVLGNAWIRSPLENLGAIFTRPLIGGVLPVHLLSYAFDYSIWELDPTGYHLHSLLLNAVNGALAFALLLRLTGNPLLAGLSALLFAVHPSHVSSAVWVSARKELLWTAFALLSTLAYLRARRDGPLDRRFYALSLGCFTLGVLSTVTIAFFPLFFLVLDHFEDAKLPADRRRSVWQHLPDKLPYLALALPVVVVNLWAQTPALEPWTRDLYTSALIKGQACWRYLWVLLGLNSGRPLYDLPPVSNDPKLVFATLLPLALPPLLLALALWRGWVQVALALAWSIAGMLAPTLFPLISFMADRYLYAPSLGFCWLLALGLTGLARFIAPRGLVHVAATLLVAALPVAHFAQVAWGYTPEWKDSMSIWSYADRSSDSARVATGLSAALIRAGSHGEAVRVLEEAPRRDARAELHLAIALLSLDRIAEAEQASSRAIRLARQGGFLEDSAVLRLLWIHGEILLRQGRVTEAEEAWKLGLQIDPGYGPLLEAIARIAGRQTEGAPDAAPPEVAPEPPASSPE